MRNKFLAMLTALIFLMALGSPVMAATMYQGRPTAYDSNTSPSFHVWQEGDRWHVQTANTGMQQHLFTGTIETNGTFSDVSTMPSASVERIVVDVRNGIIDFQFNSLAKTDGFSFTLSGGQNATFKMYIDGRPVDPSNIYLGQQNRHPDRNEFSINTVNDSYNNGSYNLSRFQGQPVAMNSVNGPGYFIWQEGDRWFLKTTTRGEQSQFTGNIRTGDAFVDVSRLNLEDNDNVRLNEASNEISFNLKTGGDQDGISFRLNNGVDATFALYMDGQTINPSNIYLGQQNLHPAVNPFNLNSRDDQYTANDQILPDTTYPTGPNTAYQTIVSANAQGEPTELDPGHVFGYFIWQDDQNRWFLNTTTSGEERHFTGTIESNGTISEVNTLRSERTDGTVVDSVSNKINFDFKAGGSAVGVSITIRDGISLNRSDKMCGLSFMVTDGASINFNLYADGQPINPSSIFLGRANRHPSSNAVKIYSSNQ